MVCSRPLARLPRFAASSLLARWPESRAWLIAGLALLLLASASLPVLGQQSEASDFAVQEYPAPAGSRPHDAVPDRFGAAWYAGQGNGTVGRLDPSTGARSSQAQISPSAHVDQLGAAFGHLPSGE